MDVGILNFYVADNILSFEIYNGELREKFKTINDFSITPVLVMSKDEDRSIYLCSFMQTIEFDKCLSVNAPFEASLPIVFECSVESMEGEFMPKLTAKTHTITTIESLADYNGAYDIHSAWDRMKWVGKGKNANDNKEQR